MPRGGATESFFSLILRRGSGMVLLVCCILTPGAGLTVAPSASTEAPPTPTTTINFASATTAITSSHFPSLPLQSPLPHSTCLTGPEFVDGVSGRVTETDHVYLDLSQPINCSGVVTRWYYCHIVIAFRNVPAELWPCVWRRSDHLEGYEAVGCNKFKVIPGKGDAIRCRLYVPSNPFDLLRVKEGDFIGFYVPDSGIILALSLPQDEIGHYQLRRNETGFSSFLADSELVRISSTPGRALLSAEIDTEWMFPSILPMSTPPATIGPTTNTTPAPTAVNVGLVMGLVIAVGVTLVLIATVIALIAYVNCKNKHLSEYNRFPSKPDDMEYNDMYKFGIANHVVVGNQRTFVKLDENPAYNSMSSTKIQKGESEEEVASSANRRQLEHTYESLSNFHVNVVK